MEDKMGVINKLRLLRQMRKNQWLKTSELEELQTKKLRAIIKHAYDNTEFYHRKFKDAGIRPEDIKTAEDIKKVPFTSKAELRKNGMGSMLTSGLDFRRSTIVQTSGSTGMPLKVVYDRATEDFSKAVNLRSMMENGLKIRDKWVNISDMRNVNKPFWFQKLGFFNMITINLFDSIEDEINALIKINPDTIIGYPSQLNLIARYIKQYNIDQIKPNNIFTTAELLSPNARKLINSVFNIELVDLFGCIEVNRTAWECSEHQGYHMDIDSVLTEFVVDAENVVPGERGEIVYTCLYNYAMPLIRYEIGDIGIPSDELCTCGRGLPLMKCVEGRKDDFIYLPSGKIISPMLLEWVMEYSHGIIEYQIVQDTIEKISLYLVISEEFEDSYIEKHKHNLQNALDNEITVDVKIRNKLNRSSGNKLRAVISKIDVNI
jgi:phenylacetate-CoA ligase